MSSAVLTQQMCFNFLVVGQVRSGSAALCSSLSGLPGTYVHVGLLDRDEAVRRDAAQSYFGSDVGDEDETLHFRDGESNPYHYILAQVFDQPRRGESRIGLRLDYAFSGRYQIHDLIEEAYRRGDFCLVHVVRNPVACLVSLKQAEQTGTWGVSAGRRDDGEIPRPVRLDREELVSFVRNHFAEQVRIRNACPDAVVVRYRDLCLDYAQQVRRVAAYVETSCKRVAVPCVKRMRNRLIRDRVYNFDDLLREVPSDVRACMSASDLY
jgi:LPS sulfotransferase NodH